MAADSHERRFHGNADRLRSPERLALLEVERVVGLCLEGVSASRVLDVGTGTGVFAEAFQAEGMQVSGVDANPALLERARELVPSADFRSGRAEDLPFPDASFDLAFLGHVLHETDDPLRALEEAKRVATKRVVVLEWPYIEDGHGPPLAHRLAPETVIEMANRAGLKSVDHTRLSHMDLYRMASPSFEAPAR